MHEGWIRFLANFSFSLFISVYLIGLTANLDEHGVQGWFKRTGWYIGQLVLFPVFVVLETTGVLAGVFRLVAGFHVVKK